MQLFYSKNIQVFCFERYLNHILEIGNFVHEIINILKRRKKKRSCNYDCT